MILGRDQRFFAAILVHMDVNNDVQFRARGSPHTLVLQLEPACRLSQYSAKVLLQIPRLKSVQACIS